MLLAATTAGIRRTRSGETGPVEGFDRVAEEFGPVELDGDEHETRLRFDQFVKTSTHVGHASQI